MDSSKRNMDSSLMLFLPNNIPPIDGSYVVIDPSNLATRNFFVCLKC